MGTKIKEVIQSLETWAPPSLRESYDNVGLLVGEDSDEITGLLVTLDCTEEVVNEAIRLGCNLIVAHHPVIFGGLKKLTGVNNVQRTVLSAIKSNIAIYAIHTNLDNIASGVNAELGRCMGISGSRILKPLSNLLWKLNVYVSQKDMSAVESALFAAGAGALGNYDQCSFSWEGEGTFRPLEGANPTEGKIGERSILKENRLEVVVEEWSKKRVHQALLSAHPYEEVAHDWILLGNVNNNVGAGMIGNLDEEMETWDFLRLLKNQLNLTQLKHTTPFHKSIRRIAWCGGSGDFLLEEAIAQGAQAFISADFKYHRFFDHQNKIMIVDIGHYESEKCVIELISAEITKKFTTFAVHKTGINTNPVQYF